MIRASGLMLLLVGAETIVVKNPSFITYDVFPDAAFVVSSSLSCLPLSTYREGTPTVKPQQMSCGCRVRVCAWVDFRYSSPRTLPALSPAGSAADGFCS